MREPPRDALWEVVERVIRDWAGSSARLESMRPLAGGLVSTTLLVQPHAIAPVVLKISSHRANDDHAREACALKTLAQIGLPAPRVLAHRVASLEFPHSYVLLEHVDGTTLRDLRRTHPSEAEADRLQHELADCVATLHAQSGDAYGKLDGERHADWPSFYRKLVDPVWLEAEKNPALPIRTRKQIARIHERLDRLLAHDDGPRLCHGDLWAGNVMCAKNGDGRWHLAAIIDPDLRHAHAEAEIAYMDCFHTITRAFKRSYAQQFKLGDDYHARRKPIYQLYALVNQLQLRGAPHAESVVAAAEKLAAKV